MKLGILVNTNRNVQALAGLTKSASDKGHEVTIFIMDEGTRLLEDSTCVSLSELGNVSMSYCDHSAIDLGVNKDAIPEAVERSSQYNNASMNHNADKVIVL